MTIEKSERYNVSLYNLNTGLYGKKSGGGSQLEHQLSVRLDMFNYPRVKAISELSGSSMNSIINDLLELGYSTMLSSIKDETDLNTFKSHVLSAGDKWYREQTEKK